MKILVSVLSALASILLIIVVCVHSYGSSRNLLVIIMSMNTMLYLVISSLFNDPYFLLSYGGPGCVAQGLTLSHLQLSTLVCVFWHSFEMWCHTCNRFPKLRDYRRVFTISSHAVPLLVTLVTSDLDHAYFIPDWICIPTTRSIWRFIIGRTVQTILIFLTTIMTSKCIALISALCIYQFIKLKKQIRLNPRLVNPFGTIFKKILLFCGFYVAVMLPFAVLSGKTLIKTSDILFLPYRRRMEW